MEAADLVGLSPDIRDRVLNEHGSVFLEALATASFDTHAVDKLFHLFHHVAPDTTARWVQRAQRGTIQDEVTCISCFARILPFATFLRPVISSFLAQCRVLKQTMSTPDMETLYDKQIVTDLLIALFRLLSVDLQSFKQHIRPIFISSFLSHASQSVRYLAVQCLSQIMSFSDAMTQDLVIRYCGERELIAPWEAKTIDYRLFKLYEEQRWSTQQGRVEKCVSTGHALIHKDRFSANDLAPTVATIGHVLIPCNDDAKPQHSSFSEFPTSLANLSQVGSCLLDTQPVLIVGPSGCGKTASVREAAHRTGRLSTMVTLHLNEQTDAKSLIGVYTSASSGSGFTWQPGVLTQAVQEGRWVLIEDIDRAPAEVLGLLRPLLENGELFLASRKEKLRPSHGFRIFGTTRAEVATGHTSNPRSAFFSNTRLWSIARFAPYSQEEIASMLQLRYPTLQPFSANMISAHNSLLSIYSTDPAFKTVQSRLPTIRDLVKWCRRLVNRLSVTSHPRTGLVPETFLIDMLKDGIDCYAAHLNDESLLEAIALKLAQNLNISPAAAKHAFRQPNILIQEKGDGMQIGRSRLSRHMVKPDRAYTKARIALTRKTRQNMEAIACAAAYREPLLLVGETGVGKTTILQYVAASAGRNLVVVNLSNQSEATDLLGGLKPLTARTLIVPLVDEFNDLFDSTFSANKNNRFRESIAKAFTKQRWQRLIGHWEEAVQLSLKSLPIAIRTDVTDQVNVKRRKLDSPKYHVLRERWDKFATKVSEVKAQLLRSKADQIFTFVESRLVQAIRNGDWVLLDEINLASPETLDSLATLLTTDDDQRPSLLLTEAGNIERITAHPEFCMFAAMNPATDTGKKDLPPAIRLHFTELYVHAGDNDIGDLVEVIHTYLGSLLENDRKAATDLAKAYLALKQLNAKQKLTDGAGDVPHFSLRSLTRCLQFVQTYSLSHGLRRAMYDGIQMSFFTSLDGKSQQTAAQVVEQCLAGSQQAKKLLRGHKSRGETDSNVSVAFENYSIPKGPLEIVQQHDYIITKSVRVNLLNLARAASMKRFPVLLQGPTSAGKTSMVEYLARYSGNKFVRINNHEHTDLQEYLGSYASGIDGRLEYKEGVLVEALRNGYWIVLDELNLAPSDVLEALNRLLDDNRELLIPETQETIRPHPNFMLFATQNPAGLYGGRKRLSRAFRNRFLEIHVDDIPEDELESILEQRSKIAPSYCKKIVEVYRQLALQRQSSRLFEARNSFATLRDLFRWASRPAETREQLANHGYMLLAERVRDQAEKAVVKSTIEMTMNVKIDDDALFHDRNIPDSLKLSTEITWTKAMRRLFVLVSAALTNNEPVLLVGETGCGKTQVCQCIAQAHGRQLDIYNAHSNTETGDLIGSQRPIRHRSELAEILLQDLRGVQGLDALDVNGTAGSTQSVDVLISKFRTIETSEIDQHRLQKIKSSISAYQSLFEWSDGSLVRAMKQGNHFLLDEISLADDSVLERLNSLLEPARTILLAEKGTDNNLAVASPQFQFLATMNPGGDYGKRELSAALRNRLTEIWVPPLMDNADVLPILQNRLSGLPVNVAPGMVDFAHSFQEEVAANKSGTVSLRALLSWSRFITTNKLELGLEKAIVHGACMTFLDSLGANPAGLVSVQGYNVENHRMRLLAELENIFGIKAIAIYNTIPLLGLEGSFLKIGDFSIPRSSTSVQDSGLIMDAPTTLRNTMRIIRALSIGRPLLLEGNPGVGKTAIVSSLARLCGKPLTRINLSDQTDLMDLFGADSPAEGEQLGQFIWRDGPLLKAMQNGHWVLLDEMNLASQSVLEGLNACLDHRQEIYIAELDKTFRSHPDFVLFATQNPHHQGGGRKGLPASFVNRFTVVYADPFTQADLERICHLKYPSVPQSQIAKMVSVVAECEDLVTKSVDFVEGGPWEVNLRDLNRWLSLCSAPGNNDAESFRTVIASRFRQQKARRVVEDLSDQKLGIPCRSSLYNILTPQHFQVGNALLPRNQQAQLRPTALPTETSQLETVRGIMIAIQQSWPVILTGFSGSGKTSLIRSLAGICGSNLIEFSMNADVDTADLVGGYEQYDWYHELLQVRARLNSVLTEELLADLQDDDVSMRGLLETCEVLELADADLVGQVDKLVMLLQNLRLRRPEDDRRLQLLCQQISSLGDSASRHSSRFVWNDGILIDALESGAWLVLDNANLCNASVLDRLNSLLEPDGCLILSEQHNSEGQARIIRPHTNFRVFLTTDPRYGELSRAMRNRSLEIYLHSPSQTKSSSTYYTPAYTEDSFIYRLRNVFVQSQTPSTCMTAHISNLVQSELSVLASPCYDDDLMPAREEALIQIDSKHEELYQGFMGDATFSKNLSEDMQKSMFPVMAAINEPMFPFLLTGDDVQSFTLVTDCHLSALRLSRLRKELQNILEVSSRFEQSSILVQSHPEVATSRRERNQITPAFHIVLALITLTQRQLSTANVRSASPGSVSLIQALLSFVEDLTALFEGSVVESSIIQAFARIGHDLLSQIKGVLPGASSGFQEIMSLLMPSDMLEQDQGLQIMWPSWKGVTSSTYLQHRARLAMERVVLHFDKLCALLPHSRAELANVRTKLLEALDAVPFHEEALQQVGILEDAINDLAKQKLSYSQGCGHFSSIFRGLVHKFTLRQTLAHESLQKLLIFAESGETLNRPLRPQTDNPLGVLQQLSYSLTLSRERDGVSVLNSQLNFEELNCLIKSSADLPIGALDYTLEEFKTLISVICGNTAVVVSDSVGYINQCTDSLLGLVLQNPVMSMHDDPRDSGSVAFDEEKTANKSSYLNVGIQQNHSKPPSRYAKALYRCRQLLQQNTTSSTGKALLILSITTLKLFVPDTIYDPAVYPSIVRQRYLKRLNDIQQNIELWKQFQRTVSGQETSMIIRIFEENLSAIGPCPEAIEIYRPTPASWHEVQAEFTNLQRAIINADLAERLGKGDLEDVPRVGKQLIQKAKISLDRLQKLDRAYDDLIEPVTALLRCVVLGADILMREVKENKHNGIDLHPDHSSSWHISMVPRRETKRVGLDQLSPAEVWGELEALELNYAFSATSDERRAMYVEQAIHLTEILFMQWKDQLATDQQASEKQSRYYSYKGEDETQDPSDADLQTMFPSYEEQVTAVEVSEQVPDHHSNSTSDARQDAISLTRYYRNILDDKVPDEQRLRHHLQDRSQGDSNQGEKGNFSALPGTFIAMQEQLDHIAGKSKGSNFNIYADSDASETRKLFDLTKAAIQRFELIAERWPDHAVPPEVLSFCMEVMSLKLKDPLVKLLTKAEKMIEIVAQWQAIASSEWSVSNLIESLTNLTIHWRRLELGSWSRLLDMEDEKMREDTDAWFFIAYEAVIHNSMILVQDGEEKRAEITTYLQGLAKTLEEFLRNATLGQFGNRLSMIRHFQKSLELIMQNYRVSKRPQEEVDRLRRIADTVQSIGIHYLRFEGNVQKSLQQGRNTFERNLAEQIKLASWKDTNITALRESARRSHFKLFKIVKKYRSLLNQPITSFVAVNSELSEDDLAAKSVSLISLGLDNLDAPSQICRETIPGWASRPERLQNPLVASKTLLHVYSRSVSQFSAAEYLREYLHDLVKSTAELRKATPSMLTDDNISFVKDLKQRKRRLLADTLKDIAHMGVQRNLGTKVLEEQSSLSVTLAKTPALPMAVASKVVKAADDAFHELLDVMSSAREGIVEHSEELTDGEVRRGLGLLEGILYLARKQRIELAHLQNSLRQLKHVRDSMTTLRSSRLEDLKLDHSTNDTTTKSLANRLAWIQSLLKVNADLLTFQADHGQLRIQGIIDTLCQHEMTAKALNEKLATLPSLPAGVQDLLSAEAEQEAKSFVLTLASDIDLACSTEPNIQYLKEMLGPWMNLSDGGEVLHDGHYDSEVRELDSNAQVVLNKIFVAVQTFSELSQAMPTNASDPAWLAATSSTYCSIFSAMHLDSFETQIKLLTDGIGKTRSSEFLEALSLVSLASATIEQFLVVVDDYHNRFSHLHLELCRSAVFFAKTYVSLTKEGFCGPSQPSQGEEESGKVEQGTGLGEGDAAEDISKDVGDDEDLTELAQEGAQNDGNDESMEKSKDAVDMGADDLEGEMGSGDEQASGDEEEREDDDENAQEMDEETGSVDDLDPNAVDEKMWDEMQKDAEKEEKEMKSQQTQGQKSDDQAAKQEGQDQQELDATEEGEEGEDAENSEPQQKAEGENVDPHTQDEAALEMPEDIQLNGEDDLDNISDADMDGMSDISNPEEQKDSTELPDEDQLAGTDKAEEEDRAMEEDIGENDANEGIEHDENLDDQNGDEGQEPEDGIKTQPDEMAKEDQPQQQGENGVANAVVGDENEPDENAPTGEHQNESAATESADQQGTASDQQQQGSGDQTKIENGVGRSEEEAQTKSDQALKKLADVLEQYHQRREIFTANEDRSQAQGDQDVDMADVDFEHAPDEVGKDTQALGTADTDANQNFDQSQAIEEQNADAAGDLPMPEDQQPNDDLDQQSLAQKMTKMQVEQDNKEEKEASTAIVPESARERQRPDQFLDSDAMAVNQDSDDLDASDPIELDQNARHLLDSSSLSHAEAQQLWQLTSHKTQTLSLMLTEQLRLILQPTTATKLRGDFRTGKRLNIRRIIPYIASGYKRDKIWMRRSIPSKRNYQVMLAVDDSKSMAESGADILALETLCMLSRALSMLEVGDLSIVAFGKDYNPSATENPNPNPQAVKIAHPFSTPFSPSTSGPESFSNFTFRQTGTDIRALLAQSIELFKDARIKSSAREAADLWQLQIIISDGLIGSDADDSVRRLVRRAREERIMCVFVVVDNGEQSIVDLNSVSFERDGTEDGAGMKMVTKRYLETFPFQYYVVVREVRDLPGVLAKVLKGWFESVVETG